MTDNIKNAFLQNQDNMRFKIANFDSNWPFSIQIKIRNQLFSQNQLGLAISQKLKILWPNRL